MMNTEITFHEGILERYDLKDLHEKYTSAQPFEHLVIDDFLSRPHYELLEREFPGPEEDMWHKFRSGKENRKLQSQSMGDIPWHIRLFLSETNGSSFTKFLEKVTGIKGLIPDPHLDGGGLHQTLSGGHLGVHVDYNYHRRWNLDRRLNVILYLNNDWDTEWGGSLEFWDKDVDACKKSVKPIGNRLVIFGTNEHSWHGHPAPLTCPDHVTRKSIALYYYSNGRPESELADEHNTVFRERPGEVFVKTSAERLRDMVPAPIANKLKRIIGKP